MNGIYLAHQKDPAAINVVVRKIIVNKLKIRYFLSLQIINKYNIPIKDIGRKIIE